MKYNCVVNDDASEDISNAMEWYEMKQPGLGIMFQQAISRKFKLLCITPEMHPIYMENTVRRGRITGYPYSVFYCVGSHIVEIIALLHDHQDNTPILQSRLK